MTSTSSLAGKRVLVTGGGGGVGATISDILGVPIRDEGISVSDSTATGAVLPPVMAVADAGPARGELFADSDDLVEVIGRPATTAREAAESAASSEESR